MTVSCPTGLSPAAFLAEPVAGSERNGIRHSLTPSSGVVAQVGGSVSLPGPIATVGVATWTGGSSAFGSSLAPLGAFGSNDSIALAIGDPDEGSTGAVQLVTTSQQGDASVLAVIGPILLDSLVAPGAKFGAAMASGCKLTGSREDAQLLVVGAPGESKIYALVVNASGLVAVSAVNTTGHGVLPSATSLGVAVACLGPAVGRSLERFVVSDVASDSSTSGRVFVMEYTALLTVNGTVELRIMSEPVDVMPSLTGTGASAFLAVAGAGNAVAAAGDVDGDGEEDLLIGAMQTDGPSRFAVVLLGAAAQVNASAISEAGASQGRALWGGVDLAGSDGVADILVGDASLLAVGFHSVQAGKVGSLSLVAQLGAAGSGALSAVTPRPASALFIPFSLGESELLKLPPSARLGANHSLFPAAGGGMLVAASRSPGLVKALLLVTPIDPMAAITLPLAQRGLAKRDERLWVPGLVGFSQSSNSVTGSGCVGEIWVLIDSARACTALACCSSRCRIHRVCVAGGRSSAARLLAA